MSSSLVVAFLVAVAANAQQPSYTVPDEASVTENTEAPGLPAEEFTEQPTPREVEGSIVSGAPETTQQDLPAFWADYQDEIGRELGVIDQEATGPEGTPAEAGGGGRRLFDAIGQGMFTATLKTAFALCIVLALILLAAYLVPRMSPYLNRLVGRRSPLLVGSELATVLGRVPLAPNAALHFVHAGGRILLIGVTQNAVSLLTEFEGAAFERASDQETGTTQQHAVPGSFLAELQTRTQNMAGQETATGITDKDIASLRSEIQRLKEYLREASSATNA